MKEKISIITISYNAEKTIESTFQSVLKQTYRPLEYVLVDGGSTDGTIALIEKYIPQFEATGIDVNFKSEQDKGISDAFNKGILRATGDIIGIINSDDQLAENALTYILDTFTDETDVVCGDCLWIDEVNGLRYVRKSKMDLDKLKYRMVLMHPTCFVRKSAYEKYGLFDVQLKCVMDKDLLARLYRCGAKFAYVPQIIAIMSAGGVSDTNIKRVYEEGIEVAVRNGVPRWKAELRIKYKGLVYKMISFAKRHMKAWRSFYNN